jgi:hypothetical protein
MPDTEERLSAGGLPPLVERPESEKPESGLEPRPLFTML